MKDSRCLQRRILTILTLLWMILIFALSCAGSDESRDQSSAVIDALCTVFVEDYGQMPPAARLELQRRMSFPVRKGAHMTEYAVLGALLTLTACEYLLRYSAQTGYGLTGPAGGRRTGTGGLEGTQGGKPAKGPGGDGRGLLRALGIALAAGFLYACSDEIHQRFVPGRSGELRDVLIDASGVLIGALIAAGALVFRGRRSSGPGKEP